MNAYFEQSGTSSNETAAVPVTATVASPFLTGGNTASNNAVLTTVAPRHFKHLTWNIDGIERSNLKKRAKAVIKIIEQ